MRSSHCFSNCNLTWVTQKAYASFDCRVYFKGVFLAVKFRATHLNSWSELPDYYQACSQWPQSYGSFSLLIVFSFIVVLGACNSSSDFLQTLGPRPGSLKETLNAARVVSFRVPAKRCQLFQVTSSRDTYFDWWNNIAKLDRFIFYCIDNIVQLLEV